MGRAMAGVAIAVVAALGAVRVNGQERASAIRPEDAGIRALIASGNERSGTFRSLTDRLDKADIVVYVRFSRCSGGVPACLVWASTGTAPRRLLIKLDRFGRSPDEVTTLLAHELQHANEVASGADIHDLASFAAAFASRGWKHENGFETKEAKTISSKVAAELYVRVAER